MDKTWLLATAITTLTCLALTRYSALFKMFFIYLPLVSVAIPLCFLALLVRYNLFRAARASKTIGMFHPYCDAGGGGERVLFCAIRNIPTHYKVVVFTGDVNVNYSILKHCLRNFGQGSTPEFDRVRFVRLHLRFLVEAETWPRFTLIGQSLGSMLLGMEALVRFPAPEIYMDTMGYAFTYPIVARFCKVACYVHYPTISTDMLTKVSGKRDGRVTSNMGKYLYYLCFAALYRRVGASATLVMVNSSWTKAHIDSLWGINSVLLYPPCLSQQQPHESSSQREAIIVSVGQFRPEKNHELQLRSLHAYNNNKAAIKLKLCMIGSCRHKQDEDLVATLRALAINELNMVEQVDFEFMINVPRDLLQTKLESSLIGVHTMWNEHFGIGIVEMMNFGLLVVAHNSGGPQTDIITPHKDGFLATTSEEYAQAFAEICSMSEQDQAKMRAVARDTSTSRFTEECFAKGFQAETKLLFTL